MISSPSIVWPLHISSLINSCTLQLKWWTLCIGREVNILTTHIFYTTQSCGSGRSSIKLTHPLSSSLPDTQILKWCYAAIYVFINSYRSQSQAWNYTIWHWSRSQNGYFNLLPPSISIILAHRWWWQDCCTNPGFILLPWSVIVWPHPSVKVWTCWILNEASPCTSHNPFDVSIVKHSQGAAAIIENHTKHKPV